MKTASHPMTVPPGITFPMRRIQQACPVCATGELTGFFEETDVPVLSTLVLTDESEAAACRRSDLNLAHCGSCGFVFNLAFDPTTQEFSDRYEDSQANSPTFGGYARELVERLCERHQLRQKTVLELGCGKGDFLAALCRAGDNRGIGIDPAFSSERLAEDDRERITAVAEFLHDGHEDLIRQADFICCRHTLEHLADPLAFLRQLRRLIGPRKDVAIFFDLPDGEAAIRQGAFWEIFYEHCCYFGEASLARLFRRAGFAVTEQRRDYGGQYLVIEAVPAVDVDEPEDSGEASDHQTLIHSFQSRARDRISAWNAAFRTASELRTVLWGSGSRAVAFLSTIRCSLDDVSAVVDVNPRRWEHFMPGVAQRIISPDQLAETDVDRVVVMNPIYEDEIRKMLLDKGTSADVTSVDSPFHDR